MRHEAETIEVVWKGPYGWPGFENENNLHPIPNIPGVYLQTFEYQGGYLIYAAGFTCRTVPIRLKEHTRKYMKGKYNVLDINAAQQGIRTEVWHGWRYARKHREEFEKRKFIIDAVRRQLAGFRIFVANVGTQRRMLERLEASIMNKLYQERPPFCDIPDKGMRLYPRRESEPVIMVKNKCGATLYGLPEHLEI